MPGLSVDSLIRGSVSKADKRDRPTSRRSSSGKQSSSNGDRNRKSSYGEDKPSREKERLRYSHSKQRKVLEIDSPPPAYSETPLSTSRSKSNSMSVPAPPVQPVDTLPGLRYPIIIAQNPREGGFCRGYAPQLAECNVPETAFFYFLDDFDRSAEASPWFSAVNIAAIGSLNRPHSTAMIVHLARKRPDTFLETVNKSFFQPRSLFALLVTWRPDVNTTHEKVNIEDPILPSSIRTLPFPKTTPLVFPYGDPTENFEMERELPRQDNPYGTGSTSPPYGRGAGIPRLGGAAGFGDQSMMGQGMGMGMGGGRMGMGMGSFGDGSGGMDMGIGGMGREGIGLDGFGGMGGLGGMGGMMGGRGGGGFGGLGGPIGLVTGLIEGKLATKSQPMNQGYQGMPTGYGDAGYNDEYMARAPPSNGYGGSEAKMFKKDAIYLMIVNLPSDDEMARFGSSY